MVFCYVLVFCWVFRVHPEHGSLETLAIAILFNSLMNFSGIQNPVLYRAIPCIAFHIVITANPTAATDTPITLAISWPSVVPSPGPCNGVHSWFSVGFFGGWERGRWGIGPHPTGPRSPRRVPPLQKRPLLRRLVLLIPDIIKKTLKYTKQAFLICTFCQLILDKY